MDTYSLEVFDYVLSVVALVLFASLLFAEYRIEKLEERIKKLEEPDE